MENRKIPLLSVGDIEVKVKQCTEKGAVALLYKTARVDMAILDEVYGSENWECDYKEIKGNLYCGIGVRTAPNQPFVWKWDCGIESREDDEGNQKKGEASDAFKRAAFKWGIGRELYTAPFTFLNVPTKTSGNTPKGKPIYELENRFARFDCKSIEYDSSGRITKVVIVDEKGVTVFSRFAEGTRSNKTQKTENLVLVPTAPVKQTRPTAEQYAVMAKLGMDTSNVAMFYKISVDELTFEQVAEAIVIKERKIAKQKALNSAKENINE